MNFSPAWPHGHIQEIFPNLFYVIGTNITQYQGVELIHSRNMIIVKEGNALTLINTVRLNENGLAQLDRLGHVSHIVRIGAFHGRDDAFYVDHYKPKFWMIKGMDTQVSTDPIEMVPGGLMPFKNCSLFKFDTSIQPEAILHFQTHDGILIACDSIKNWMPDDEFFSQETKELYKELGFFGPATISSTWIEACQVQPSDFKKLLDLKFKHLISAHGKPSLNNAYAYVKESTKKMFESLTS